MSQSYDQESIHNLNPNGLSLVEYGDYSCLRCQALQKVVNRIFPPFEGKLSYQFRHFPNLSHPRAFFMSLMAEAARRQGKYSVMHQALFVQANPISIKSAPELAKSLGLQIEWFLADLQDETLKDQIWADIEQGRQDGVVQTPMLFLGIHRLHGKLTQARLGPLLNQYVKRPLLLRNEASGVTSLNDATGRYH
ncbi:thioredoxin domain-containing protein [Spirosoma aureum]|uniref:Thioredoxin domain-containing protein n=1 Tax=Spirosoma aureum TaxID=2692134 RepID=A0A6G9AMM9_9BACT|nr:thioredoxin domain-containing protein [Spirosoma aureum]QIP13731.1 thioredoxin domain-containing protein [Spirosoma aureum]